MAACGDIIQLKLNDNIKCFLAATIFTLSFEWLQQQLRAEHIDEE